MSKVSYLKALLDHPVNANDSFGALVRIARWYVGSRLVHGPVLVPFIEGTRLLMNAKQGGVTENIYTGLSEFEDMSFALHLATDEDFFVDIGANVGAYTILVSGVRGACTLAIEPIPDTCRRLRENVLLNGIDGRVEVRNLGVAQDAGQLRFTDALNTVNHVTSYADETQSSTLVDVVTLDALLAGRVANFVKIDVEGFEAQVIRGGRNTFSDPNCLAAVIETNESGQRYGSSDAEIDSLMASFSFARYTYQPLERRLLELAAGNRSPTLNTIYIKDVDKVNSRLKSAPRFHVGQLTL